MKTLKSFILPGIFLSMTVLLSFCNADKEPTDPENPNKKQEILPKGKNENYEKGDTLTVGEADSLSLHK